MRRNAVLTECGKHRLLLERHWSGPANGPALVILGLNPSEANADRDDPTSRRGVGFATREGLGRLLMVNLYSLISKTPIGLFATPEERRNAAGADDFIFQLFAEAPARGDIIVAGFGSFPQARARSDELVNVAAAMGTPLHSLRVNADGSPGHPLYLRSDAPLEPWPPAQYLTAPSISC